MKRSGFGDKRIIGMLREDDAGASVADLGRGHAVSSATFQAPKAGHGGGDVPDPRRLKALGAGNAKREPLRWGCPTLGMPDDAGSKDLLSERW